MKIAMVKQECSNGDKVTVAGTVKWIGKVEAHEGQDGEFRTQTLLLVDGPQTDDKRNSIFCGFSADGRSMKPEVKGEERTIQGTINVYDGKMSLRNCKVKEAPPQAPQQAAQGQKSAKPTQDYQRPKTPEEAAKIGRMWAITSALANIRNRVLAGDKDAINGDEYELAVRYKYFADTGEKLKIADQDHSNYTGHEWDEGTDQDQGPDY